MVSCPLSILPSARIQTVVVADTSALNTTSLVLDDFQEVMVILRSFPSRAVTKVCIKFLVEITLDILFVLTAVVSSIYAANGTLLHNALFTATKFHRAMITGRHHIINVVTRCCSISLQLALGELVPLPIYSTYAGPSFLIGANVHLTLEGVVKARTISHVLVLRVVKLLIEFVCIGLFHEQNKVGVVGLLNDASEVHSVVHLVFGLEHLFKAKVVVTFLQSVEGYVFVVASEDILVFVAGRRGVSQNGVVSLWDLIVLVRDDSCLCGINAEVIIEPILVVPICAVSHFIS